MMMVVTVMAVALHLLKAKAWGTGVSTGNGSTGRFGRFWLVLLLKQINDSLIEPIAEFKPIRCARHVSNLRGNT